VAKPQKFSLLPNSSGEGSSPSAALKSSNGLELIESLKKILKFVDENNVVLENATQNAGVYNRAVLAKALNCLRVAQNQIHRGIIILMEG